LVPRSVSLVGTREKRLVRSKKVIDYLEK